MKPVDLGSHYLLNWLILNQIEISGKRKGNSNLSVCTDSNNNYHHVLNHTGFWVGN